MRRITTFLLTFITLSVIFTTSCSKDDEAGLTGTYSRSQQFGDNSHTVELQFTGDGALIWRPADTIPGHTASTVKYEKLTNARFRIFDDPECGNEGTYTYVADKKGLEVTVETDDCQPRANAMSGYWSRK